MSSGGRDADGRLPVTAATPLPSPEILRRRRRFAHHLLAFLAVTLLLVAVWLTVAAVTGSWFFWPIVVLVGWGVLLDAHAWWAYGRPSRGGREHSSAT
jgi:uncharacterized membrane protein